MILCELYDYIEIACMHHLEVLLTLKDGTEWKGVAQDTARNAKKEECIKLILTGTGDDQLVVLDDLLIMESIIKNPHFRRVDFPSGATDF
ncbi:Rho-binding antiterminator [Marinomonas sp. 2405UD68-3]|uniref:Rho-binding antiterminator n=1 Tax=Marinomonas sp. 2405UD68-3 TaxID=3391835 RepID=UPI0039C9C6A0